MKTIIIKSLIAASVTGLFCCEKQEKFYEDSPMINVTSPYKNQTFTDKDSIIVKATLIPESADIKTYHIFIVASNKKDIYNEKSMCNCKGERRIEIRKSFYYNTKGTSNLLLQLHAELENGEYIREEVPFTVMDSKE